MIRSWDDIQKIRPYADWVLVELKTVDLEYYSDGVVTVRTKKFHEYGRVLRVGPGRINKKTGKRIPMTLKEGDIVFIANPAKGEFVNNDLGLTLAFFPEPLIEGVVVSDFDWNKLN